VRLGHITQQQLDVALEHQVRCHRKLGEILVEQKACTHRDVHTAVELQQRLASGGEEPLDERLTRLRQLLDPSPLGELSTDRRLADIGRTLSSTLHDLRTSLTIIGGYARLMSNDDDPSARMAHSRIIDEQLESMAEMLEATLAYARGDAKVLRRTVKL